MQDVELWPGNTPQLDLRIIGCDPNRRTEQMTRSAGLMVNACLTVRVVRIV